MDNLILIANGVVLLGGILTWTSNWLLGNKNRTGWLIKLFALICYTLGPALAGVYAAVFVNSVTAFTQIRAFRKWGK